MTFTSKEHNIFLDLRENMVSIITIENPEIFLNVENALLRQSLENIGPFIICEGTKELKFNSSIEVILSPNVIDFNNRKIQNKLLTEAKNISSDYFYNDFIETRAYVCKYLESVTSQFPFPLEYDFNFDENIIFKSLGLKLQTDNEDLLQRFLSYITISQQLLSIKLLVTINLKDYFTTEQLREIYKCCFYNKIQLLIIESHQHMHLDNETGIIIDADKCIINY